MSGRLVGLPLLACSTPNLERPFGSGALRAQAASAPSFYMGEAASSRVSAAPGQEADVPAGLLSAGFGSYSQFLRRIWLTALGHGATISAVTLMSRHFGAVSDPVRSGPDVGVRSLKTEQYSSA
jgi:hypothetical protein